MTSLEEYCDRFDDMDAAAARWNRDADGEDVTLEDLAIVESLVENDEEVDE